MHMNNLRGLSEVAKNLKQPGCLSVRGWINKLVIRQWDGITAPKKGATEMQRGVTVTWLAKSAGRGYLLSYSRKDGTVASRSSREDRMKK